MCAHIYIRADENDTYARYGANLDDSIAYQAYHATTSYEVTDQAVADTAGMVMTYKGKLADCYYYSTSRDILKIWKYGMPHLRDICWRKTIPGKRQKICLRIKPFINLLQQKRMPMMKIPRISDGRLPCRQSWAWMKHMEN